MKPPLGGGIYGESWQIPFDCLNSEEGNNALVLVPLNEISKPGKQQVSCFRAANSIAPSWLHEKILIHFSSGFNQKVLS
jgi:hypothetical protein